MREIDIQNQILDYLNRQEDCFAFRVNTGGIYDPSTKVFRQPGKFSLKGTSDILGCFMGGFFFAIEVKSESGKVSDEQRGFLDKIKRTGGYAIVARSLDDAKELVQTMRGVDNGLDRECGAV